MRAIHTARPRARALAAIAFLAMGGCGSDPAATSSSLPVVALRLHGGLCYGYCDAELLVEGQRVTYTRLFVPPGAKPDIVRTTRISGEEWADIVRALDFDALDALPDRIGCPGCADAPSEEIVAWQHGREARVHYEAPDAPPVLEPLRAQLWDLQRRLAEEPVPSSGREPARLDPGSERSRTCSACAWTAA